MPLRAFSTRSAPSNPEPESPRARHAKTDPPYGEFTLRLEVASRPTRTLPPGGHEGDDAEAQRRALPSAAPLHADGGRANNLDFYHMNELPMLAKDVE
jgi:hypothetical protein